MQLDWRIRVAMICSGALIVAAAIAGAAWGTLDSELVEHALSIVGGVIAGLGLAGGPAK